MVHFLRNENNRTIIECEVTKDDLSAAIDVQNYSLLLLKINKNPHDGLVFISHLSDLNEIRGNWWERERDFGGWDSIDKFVETQFTNIAKKWNLNYIID